MRRIMLGFAAISLLVMLVVLPVRAGYKVIHYWGTKGDDTGQFHAPNGIDLDSTGNVYVADRFNNRVQVFDSTGNLLRFWTLPDTGIAEGLAINADNKIYVAQMIQERVLRYSSTGTLETTWGSAGPSPGEFNYPWGVAVGPDGSVYVVDYFNYRIQKFNQDGGLITTWGSQGSGPGQFDRPKGIAVGADGKVYVADASNFRVQVFSDTGAFLAQFGGIGNSNGKFVWPHGVTLDGAGKIYVSDNTGRIQIFNSGYGFETSFGSYGTDVGQNRSALGLTVDGSGNVYVTDELVNRVQVFAPARAPTPVPPPYVGGGATDFEEDHFPPTGWSVTGPAGRTELESYSPTHSLLLSGAGESVITPRIGKGDKLNFAMRVGDAGFYKMIRIDYSLDLYTWAFFGKYSVSAGHWSSIEADISDLPSQLYLRLSWDEFNDAGTTIYLDDIEVEADRGRVESSGIISSGDYTGDGRSDIAIFRPQNGLWAVRGLGRTYYGQEGDIPVSGDYNGDGISDIAVYRPESGLWAVKNITRVYLGDSRLDPRPVPGDYNGDGTCDLRIFQGWTGAWLAPGESTIWFGTAGDKPIPADYDGDGNVDIAVFRPQNGLWAVRGLTRWYYGRAGDIPLPGSYRWYEPESRQTAFRDIPGLFRPETGLWAIRDITRLYFGSEGDTPVVGDFTGNSIDNLGIARLQSNPSGTGLWAIREVTRAYFGQEGDQAVTR